MEMKAAFVMRCMVSMLEILFIAGCYWAISFAGQFVAIDPGEINPFRPTSGISLSLVI